jgi:hypothetical protein
LKSACFATHHLPTPPSTTPRYASLKQAAPPGPVKYLFMAVYRLEDRLNETPETKKLREDKWREKARG